MKSRVFPLSGKALLPLAISAFLLGCGDSGSSDSNDYRLSGTLSGLVEGSQVTLRDAETGSGLADLVLTENGSFTFQGSLKANDRYLIEVAATTHPAKPSAGSVQLQSCVITEGADGDATGQTKSLTGLAVDCASQFIYYADHQLFHSDGTETGTETLKQFADQDSELVALGQQVFFAANGSDGKGTELWVTDGTATGTQLVKDINTGSNSSWPESLTVLGDRLYFSATDGVGVHNNKELWVSDGTEAGTQLLKDIHPTNSSYPDYLTVLGDRLYFSAGNDVNGTELWVTDGTEDGTKMVKDINEGANSSRPEYLIAWGDQLYFAARENAESEMELWVTDGTAAGTQMVKDIWTESAYCSCPYDFVVLNEQLFFFAESATANGGAELWTTDGTEAGTQRVAGFPVGDSWPENPVVVGQQLYFKLWTPDVGSNKFEVWVSDGTSAGTRQVTLPDDSPLISTDNQSLLVAGAQLFVFAATSGYSDGAMYRVDGSSIEVLKTEDDQVVQMKSVVGRSSEGTYLFGMSRDGMQGLWFLPNGSTQIKAINVVQIPIA